MHFQLCNLCLPESFCSFSVGFPVWHRFCTQYSCQTHFSAGLLFHPPSFFIFPKEQLKFQAFMEIEGGGSTIPLGFGLCRDLHSNLRSPQYLHLPGFSQKPFSMLHPALHSQPWRQRQKGTTSNKKNK